MLLVYKVLKLVVAGRVKLSLWYRSSKNSTMFSHEKDFSALSPCQRPHLPLCPYNGTWRTTPDSRIHPNVLPCENMKFCTCWRHSSEHHPSFCYVPNVWCPIVFSEIQHKFLSLCEDLIGAAELAEIRPCPPQEALSCSLFIPRFMEEVNPFHIQPDVVHNVKVLGPAASEGSVLQQS